MGGLLDDSECQSSSPLWNSEQSENKNSKFPPSKSFFSALRSFSLLLISINTLNWIIEEENLIIWKSKKYNCDRRPSLVCFQNIQQLVLFACYWSCRFPIGHPNITALPFADYYTCQIFMQVSVSKLKMNEKSESIYSD